METMGSLCGSHDANGSRSQAERQNVVSPLSLRTWVASDHSKSHVVNTEPQARPPYDQPNIMWFVWMKIKWCRFVPDGTNKILIGAGSEMPQWTWASEQCVTKRASVWGFWGTPGIGRQQEAWWALINSGCCSEPMPLRLTSSQIKWF